MIEHTQSTEAHVFGHPYMVIPTHQVLAASDDSKSSLADATHEAALDRLIHISDKSVEETHHPRVVV